MNAPQKKLLMNLNKSGEMGLLQLNRNRFPLLKNTGDNTVSLSLESEKFDLNSTKPGYSQHSIKVNFTEQSKEIEKLFSTNFNKKVSYSKLPKFYRLHFPRPKLELFEQFSKIEKEHDEGKIIECYSNFSLDNMALSFILLINCKISGKPANITMKFDKNTLNEQELISFVLGL